MVVNLWASWLRALPPGDADPPGLPRAVRRPGRRCSASTTRTRRPSRPWSSPPKTGVTYPLLADPQGDLQGQAPFPAGMGLPFLALVDETAARPWSPASVDSTSRRARRPGRRAPRGRPVTGPTTTVELPEWLRPVQEAADSITVARADPVHAARGRRRPPGRRAHAVRRGRERRRAAAHRARPPHALPPRPGVVPRWVDRPGRDRRSRRRCARPRRRPGSTRPASTCSASCPSCGCRRATSRSRRCSAGGAEPTDVSVVESRRGARHPPGADQRAARPRAPDHRPPPERLARARAS